MLDLQTLPEGCTLGLTYTNLHDSAIAVVGPDGQPLFACSLERLSRVKQDGRWPLALINAVPWERVERLAVPMLHTSEARDLSQNWAKGGWPLPIENGRPEVAPLPRAWHERMNELPMTPVRFDHHHAHAASAWFLSGLDKALVLTCDGGAGDCPWLGAAYRAEGSQVDLVGGMAVGRHRSIANVYTLITALLGLRPNCHEGKVTGLAARGSVDLVDEFVEIAVPLVHRLDDLLQWDSDYDSPNPSRLVVNPEVRRQFRERFGAFSDVDLAACVQLFAENLALQMCQYARDLAGHDLESLCLAGGVFANVRINQRLANAGFSECFVVPPMTDDGVALGAALLAHAQAHPDRPSRCESPTMFLGPAIDSDDAEAACSAAGLRFEKRQDLPSHVATALAGGKTVAVSRGRMEFGPRALGNRSVLCEATDPRVNNWLNKKLQRTEYMPFAPITRLEDASHCYVNTKGIERAARFMTITVDCTSAMKQSCPAVVHVDGTARPQLVRESDAPFLHRILGEYQRRTGLPSLINTSFNVHEEPIVCSVQDALSGFAVTGLDILILGDLCVPREGNGEALSSIATNRERPRGWTESCQSAAMARWLSKVQVDLRVTRERWQVAVYEQAKLIQSNADHERAWQETNHRLEAMEADRERAWRDTRYLLEENERLRSSKALRLAILVGRVMMPLRAIALRCSKALLGLARLALPRRVARRLEQRTRYGRLPWLLKWVVHRLLPAARADVRTCPFDRIDYLVNSQPRVTVVVPCHEHGPELLEALGSLQEQTFPFFEVFVVDDGSTGVETVEIIDRLEREGFALPSLEVIRQSNMGPAKARNRGVRAGSAPYVLCLDADDKIEPSCLMEMVSLLDSRPDVGIAYCDIRFFGDKSEVLETPEYDLPALLDENFMVVTSLFRRSLFGGYNESLVLGYEDWCLWIDFARLGWYGKRIPKPLFSYRIDGEGRNAAAIRENLGLIKQIKVRNRQLYEDSDLLDLWRKREAWIDPCPRARPWDCVHPLVSIIIPCYNYGEYVEDAVRSAVEQTWPNLEIIVVDDGSTDESTIKVLREARWPKTRIVHQRNQGLAAARNRGFREAKGDYLLPLDADDMIMPEMVEKCMEAMRKDSAAGWVYTDIRFFDERNGVHKQEHYNPWLELTNNHSSVCALIRRQAWEDAGGYNSNMAKGYEDWDFWVHGAYFCYRLHGTSMVTESLKHHQHLVNTIRQNHSLLYLPWNVEAMQSRWMGRTRDCRHLPLSESAGSSVTYKPSEGHVLFSVVIPVYKHERFLEECISSVLSQGYGHFELILVDDASLCDEVDKILARYVEDPRVTVLVNATNQHISRTLNRGILRAKGEYIVFVDCDDRLHSNTLERVHAYLTRGDTKYYVSTQILDIDEDGTVVRRRERPQKPRDLYTGNFAGHLKVVKREVLERVGLFDPALSGCQDYDLVLRIQEVAPIHFLQEYLYEYRWHAGSISVTHDTRQEEVATQVVQWCRYRRWLFDHSIQKSFWEAITVVIADVDEREMEAAAGEVMDSSGLPVEVIVHSGEQDCIRYAARSRGEQSCSGVTTINSRGLGVVQTEWVFFLDKGMSLESGCLEHLLFMLTSHQVDAATAVVGSADAGCDGALHAPEETHDVPLFGTLFRRMHLEDMEWDGGLPASTEGVVRQTRPDGRRLQCLVAPQARIVGPRRAVGHSASQRESLDRPRARNDFSASVTAESS
ncbi:MAG: glycosyltransferase [Planctomycetota bacterium]